MNTDSKAVPAAEGLSDFYGQVPVWSVRGGVRETVVEVPLDYGDPGGRRIGVAVGMVPAADPSRRRGVLVALNGGPGGHGGLGRSMPLRLVGSAVHEVYDLVGFDPRGWGRSSPVMRENVRPVAGWSSRPGDEEFAVIAEDMRAMEEGAARAGGELRAHVTTRNVARDLDIIRSALGEERISYLGYAYGSYLGAVYGVLFGSRVDRHVLDSCVDPGVLWRGQYMAQAVAIRRNVDAWAGWAGRFDGVYGLGADPAAVLESVEAIGARLRDTPLGGVDRTVLDGLVGLGAAHRPLWAQLAATVRALGAGDTTATEAAWLLAQPGWEPPDPDAPLVSGLVEATTSEGEWPSDLETYYRDMRHYRRHYPYGYGVQRAQPWVAAFRTTTPREPMTPITRRDYGRGLICHAQGNPTLSHTGARAMADALDDRLITLADDGSNELFAVRDQPALTALVTDYLLNGTLPATDVILPGPPLPRPTPHPHPETIKNYLQHHNNATR